MLSFSFLLSRFSMADPGQKQKSQKRMIILTLSVATQSAASSVNLDDRTVLDV